MHTSITTVWLSTSLTSSSPATVLQQLYPGWLAVGTSDTLLPKDLVFASYCSEVLLTLTSPGLSPCSGFLTETFLVCSLPQPPSPRHALCFFSVLFFSLVLELPPSDIHILILYLLFSVLSSKM